MKTELARRLDRETALDLYGQMALIRRFEAAAYRGYEQGDVFGTVHSSAGQEAVAVGTISTLMPDDAVLSHHRGHGHALAKGVPPHRLMAELYGRGDGVSRGRGGSMHATDVSHNFLGTMAIVGSCVPLATGVALSFVRRQSDQVILAFFGDGGINQGVVYESFNLAALWSLPVVFVCENNGYAITTPTKHGSAGSGIVERAASFGLQSVQVDGQDVMAVRHATSQLVDQARSGMPALLECVTYRFMGHSRGDPAHGVYRSKDELDEWKRRDPLTILAESVPLGQAEISDVDKAVKETIDQAVVFAENSPYPDGDDLQREVSNVHPT